MVNMDKQTVLDFLNRSYDMMVDMSVNLDYPMTEARRAKFAGYRQAIIDIESMWESSPKNEESMHSHIKR